MTATQQGQQPVRLDELSQAECEERLRTQTVGRIAFFQDDEVEVLPVNYVLDEAGIAFRTTGGSKLRPGTQYSTVTFEVDELQDDLSLGWSVVVKGWADAVSDQATVDRLDATGLRPWAHDVERPIWVIVHPKHTTGRAIRPASE